MAGNDLQLEYGVKFDVKTGGANATAEIEALSKSWQALLDKQKLVIKMGVDAEKYAMGGTSEAKANNSAAENDRNKQAKQLKELSAYYKELSDRARDFYNANLSDKNAALDGMKKRLEQIKKEKIDILNIDSKSPLMFDQEKGLSAKTKWIADLNKEAAGIQAAIAALNSVQIGGSPANVQKLISDLTTTNFTLLQMREYYKQAEIESKKLAESNAKLVKDATSKSNTKDVLGMKEGSIEEIEKKIQKLNQSMQIFSNTASKVGMNDEKLNGAFRKANDELNRLQQKLANLQAGFGNRSLSSLLQINPKSIQEANALMAELARRRDALNRTDPGYANSISAINKKQAELSAENARALGLSEQKTKAINNETAAFDKQSTVISNLRNMAATYLSIYEAGRLIKNIAVITGQFELQEKSLAAIIQSADKANEIFGQVKNLAVISPFKFSELLSYTKQLAAYRVETDQLYDTMKNLADVSAGLGVDMSRIILAYGQVRAASVLRGQELRQFTEAGIPLVALLADKFTELEGRVVSTGEVFGKISERMVSFEMVKDIFADMSGEGGMFYNMQEIQAETLAGKISNLTDAYQIMFASIGGDETLNGILKGSIDLVTKLARNWREVWDVMKLPLTLFTGYKAINLALAGYQSLIGVFYAKNMAYQQAAIGMNDREVASLARKTAFQEASLAANKGKIASDAIMNFTSAQTIAMDKREIVSKSIKLAIIKAGSDATKVANLQNEISIILTTAGVSKDRAAAMARLGLAVATNTATASTITFGTTMKALWAISPLGWIVAIVAALISVGYWLTSSSRAAEKFQKELTKIGNAGTNEALQLAGRFKTLSETARDSTKSLKEQNDALSTLKQVYGDILPDYMLTIDGLTEIGDKYDKVTAAIYANIEAKTKEKKITAITDNYDEKVNPIIDGLKTDLGDVGVDAVLAGKAIAELQKRINDGTVTENSPFKELEKILKEINGTEIQWTGGFQARNFAQLRGGANKLTEALLGQKKAIEELNQTPTTFYGNFAKEAAKIEGKIKEATENIIKGQKIEGGKTVYFDESIYQFNRRKADAEREKLIEHIRKTTGLAFDTVQAELAKNGGKDLNLNFGVVNWLESAVSRVAAIDTSPVANKVNDILQAAAKEQGINASRYDKYAFKGQGADGEEYFKTLISSHQALQEKIAETKRANSEWVSDIVVKSEVAANGYRQITKAEYLNGYFSGGKRIEGLNQEIKTVEQLMAAFGKLDKKAKTSTVNPRIAAIEAEIALVEQAKKKYEELIKAGKSPEQSKAIVDNLYKDQFKLKDKKGQIIFETVVDEKSLIGQFKKAKGEFQKISKTEKQVFNVGLKINESEIKIFTDEVKTKLSEIEKEFNTSKKRIDIFKSIFDTTGDSNLAKKIAESIEGAGTVDLASALNKSFKEAFKVMDIDTTPLFDKMGNVDIQAAQKAIDLIPKESDSKKEAQKQLDIVKDFQAKEISELLKGLTDFESYEAKKTKIAREGIEERYKISITPGMSDEVKKQKTDTSLKKEAKEISKVNVEQFKESPMWADTFSNLDKMSDKSILLLKSKLKELIESEQGVAEPTQLKELMKALEDIEKRTADLNFSELFKAIFDDVDLKPFLDEIKKAAKEVDVLIKAKNDALTNEGNAKAETKKVLKEVNGDENNQNYVNAKKKEEEATNAVTDATVKLSTAQEKLAKSEKDYADAANKRTKALGKAEDYLNKQIDALKKVQSAYDSVVSAVYDVADAFGMTFGEDTKELIDAFSKGFGAVISVLSAVLAVIIAIDAAVAINPILLAIAAGIAVLAGAFAMFKYFSLKPVNDELKSQKNIVAELEKEYAKLEQLMQQSLGSDWIKAYNKELINLSSTVTSLSRQIELEKSKGKDADQAKIDEFQKSLDDTNQKIVDSKKKLEEFVSGTDLTSAAKDFATAWLEAYKSFGSTTEAMKARFKDMINNMIVNTLLTKAMEIALTPVFDKMKEYAGEKSEGGEGYTVNELASIMAETTKSTANANASLTYIMDGLKGAGLDFRDTNSNLTGLSRGIQGLSEDTALLLGGYLNSIRFRMFEYLDKIEAVPAFDMKSNMAILMTAQNTQINHLEGIKANTLRSAIASENLSAKIDSVFAPSITGSGYALKVNA